MTIKKPKQQQNKNLVDQKIKLNSNFKINYTNATGLKAKMVVNYPEVQLFIQIFQKFSIEIFFIINLD